MSTILTPDDLDVIADANDAIQADIDAYTQKERSMVSYEQALSENYFHKVGGCSKVVGPRGGVKHHQVIVRRNGATKTWKTRPGEFRIPVKYGLYEYGYIDNNNADEWIVEHDCPVCHPTEG